MADGPAPVLIGVLYDFPTRDGAFEDALRLGLATVSSRLDRAVELLPQQATGLPSGSAHELTRGFKELDQAGCLAIVGPSITDNGIVARDLADAARIPCINYTGGEVTRSAWMFHYQVGSLEEEPILLAQTLLERGLMTTGCVYDDSPVGRRYAEAFTTACADRGIDLLMSCTVSALAEDLTGPVGRVKTANPASLCYLGLGVSARAVALAMEALSWTVPVVANSALMFGYLRKDWRAGWEDWTYVDTIADDNPLRVALMELDKRTASGSVGVAGYDIGRLLGEAIVRSGHLTRDGIRLGLERTKRMPATSGHAGTLMGFGNQDHAALKGEYLVLRAWRDERSVQLERTPPR
ncbi:MAG TPA: ABC transporter substrate-binding protein [Mycobacteriales bacterium]|nr:ABC transporter substrate-binding protein [Mycobacteriales bacterium]